MKCANCGNNILTGSSFCPVCKAPIIDIPQMADGEGFHPSPKDTKTYIDFRNEQRHQIPLDDHTCFDSPYHQGGRASTPAGDHTMNLSGQGRQGADSPYPDDITRMGKEETPHFYFENQGRDSFGRNNGAFQSSGGFYDGPAGGASSGGNFYADDSEYDPSKGSYYREDPGVYGYDPPLDPPFDQPPAGPGIYVNDPGGEASGVKRGWWKDSKKIIAITVALLLASGLTTYGAVQHHRKVQNQERADRVVRMIDQLGEPDRVDLEDRTDIDVARNAFDELTDEQKELVDNDLSLFSAESVINQLERKEDQNNLSKDELDRQDEIIEEQQKDLTRKTETKDKGNDLRVKPYYYVMSDPVSWGAYKVVTKSDPLTLRTGPGYSYKTIAKMPKGSIVYVYGSYNGWYYVEYKCQWGWANARYLSEQTDQPVVPEKTPSDSNGYLKVESNPSYMGDYEIVANKLHLRSGPGSDYCSRAIMSKGDQVAAYGSYGDWLYIEHKGQMGWANGKSKYMKSITKPVKPPKAQEIENNPTYDGDYTVDANELTLRTGPGTGFGKITVLKKGDKVNGYDSYNGWKYVEYKDKWGWMKENYLKKSSVSTPVDPANPTYDGEYTIDANELTLRTGPGTEYSQITVLKKGEKVNGYDLENGWRYVEYKDKWGWMKDKYLKKSEGSHLIEPDNPGYMGDYTVTTEDSDLSMRLGPGDSYDKAGSIPKGATVAVYASQDGWYYVEYDGKNGWSKSKYLTKGTVSEDEETKEDQSQPEEEETEESSEEDQGEDTADTQQEQETDDSGESSEEE